MALLEDDQEYHQKLLEKLREEIDEAKAQEDAEEAADVYEVSDTFTSQFGSFSVEHAGLMEGFDRYIEERTYLSPKMIVEAQMEKQQKLGGFTARMYVDTVSMDEGNPWLPYWEEKYPEVK